MDVVLVLGSGDVSAISDTGSKANVLADGFAELSDEKVSFSTFTLTLVSVSWAELQQMLIWFVVWVHTSLSGGAVSFYCSMPALSHSLSAWLPTSRLPSPDRE